MKDGLKYLVGRRIAGVVVAKGKDHTRNQVFLVFPDGSRFEFYGENFSCCAGLDDARRIQSYVESGQGMIERVYDEPLGPETGHRFSTGPERGHYAVAPPESLMGRMKRDLEAWELAKAAIGKAKGTSLL